MPLSNVQKGAVGQYAFLSTALATGGGQVEAYTPVADNEGRDSQIRRHLKPMPGISVQIKVAFYLTKDKLHGKRLSIVVNLPAKRVQHDPRFWYFFGFYDTSELRLHNPVFLVPSDVFHKQGRARTVTKGRIWFVFSTNPGPESHDMWSPYRVAPKDLGKRLLEIVDSAGLTADGRMTGLPPGGIWLSRAKASRMRRLRRAA